MEIGDPALPSKFWDNVRIRNDGCWEWTGTITPDGYGSYGYTSAHRAMAATVGFIPAGMVVDHTCHDRTICVNDEGRSRCEECPHRRCCNPDHLEVVTHRENMRRGGAWTSPRRYPRPGDGEMSATDFRTHLPEVLDAADAEGRITVITNHGRRYAAVVPVNVAQAHQQRNIIASRERQKNLISAAPRQLHPETESPS